MTELHGTILSGGNYPVILQRDSDLEGDVLEGDPSQWQGPPGENGLSAYEIAVLYGFIGTEAEWLDSLEGPPGPQGPQGIQGIPGVDGVDGVDGTNGIDGDDGLSAYQIAVLNGFVGTEAAWLDSLVGEQGPQGIQGPAGATGPQGEAGTPGADGDSAYEVAVANGYVGTEAQWLASLVGAAGPRGGFGGDSALYDFSTTTTVADPGSGLLRFNNATFASITQVIVDDLDTYGVDLSAWWQEIGSVDNPTKGILRIFKESDTAVFRTFEVTAATDQTGYWLVAVTPIVAAGVLNDTDPIVVSFARAGDQGAPVEAADIATVIDGAGEITTPAGNWAAVVTGVLKRITWANIETYLGTLFAPISKGVTNGDTHDHAGGDGAQISYSNLADVPPTFTPTAHATSHQHGGADEVGTATPGANAIVKADADGKIGAGWLDDADISLDNVTEGTTNKFYTATEQTKLAGIEAGAEVNTVDSVNTQTGAVVLDSDDIAEGLANLYYTAERARDDVGGALTQGNGIGITVNDLGDTITLALAALTSDWDIGEDRAILAERFNARDAEGLSFYDMAGNRAIYIADGGKSVTVGDGTGIPAFNIDGAVETARQIIWRTAGISRWIVRVDSALETGANAGTNFEIISRDDSGAILRADLEILRDTGAWAIAGDVALLSGKALTAETIKAVDASGVIIQDDGGNIAIVVEDGGQVGFGGITDPNANVEVSAASGVVSLRIAGYGTALSNSLAIYTPRGTRASPSANLAGDVLGLIAFGGYDTDISNAAFIRVEAAADFGSAGDTSDSPGNLLFLTTPDGSGTPLEAMRLNSDQSMTLTRTTAGAMLNFTGGYSLTEGANTFPTGFYRGSADNSIVMTIIRGAAAEALMGAGINGESFRRFLMQADGKLLWGGGTLTRDVTLYRNSADHLKTDDDLIVAGDLSAGVDAASGKLHTHDGTSGFISVTKTGIVGAAQTIIADGTGDVTNGIIGLFVMDDGSASVMNMFSMSQGGTTTTDITIGTSTWRITLNVNGSLTVARTAGTATGALTLMMTWQ